MSTNVIGVVAYLPSGGEAMISFRAFELFPYRGPLAAACLAQMACRRAGFYKAKDDYPMREDVRVVLAAAKTFLLALNSGKGLPIDCPDDCAWVVRHSANSM